MIGVTSDTWRIGQDPLAGAGPLVTPHDVGGEVAWQDLRRSGAVRELFDGAGVAADAVVTPALRAGALRPFVPTKTVVAALSAAWVWAAAPRPRVVELICTRDVHRPPPHPARRSRQAVLLRAEVADLDGVLVTCPLRTALDVATRADAEDARAVLRELARRGLAMDAVRRSLELRYRWAGRDRARQILAAAR